ncbi:CPBP family intramembrane metalloprotease [Acidobacteria bacterium AH-259-L09]|nr:CPBP family intramembrane metalloprotease [Acidobacteria bacterium AH-259-L09]
MSPIVVVVLIIAFFVITVRRRFRPTPMNLTNGLGSVRGASVLLLLFVSFVGAYILVDSVLPDFWDPYSFWPDTAFEALAYAASGLTVSWYVRSRGVNHREIFGSLPTRGLIRCNLYRVIPLVALSVGSVWLLYLPLSYLAPEFTSWWLLERPPIVIFESGTFSLVPNLASFFLVAVLAPVIEEYVFRGVLLRCWTVRWGTAAAVWVSSAVFAIAHVDILGAFVFGFVTSVVYIRSGSLLIPICIHIVSNSLGWLLHLGESLARGPGHSYTLSEFQSEWWIGALALLAAGPWAYRFIVRNLPRGRPNSGMSPHL